MENTVDRFDEARRNPSGRGLRSAERRNQFTVSGKSTKVGGVVYKKWRAADAKRPRRSAEWRLRERSWMKLVLAGTEITSLISIKEREGHLLFSPRALISSSSASIFLCSSSPIHLLHGLSVSRKTAKLRKHISFILLPPARARDFATQHILDLPLSLRFETLPLVDRVNV